MVPYINNYYPEPNGTLQQRIEFGRNNSAFVPIKDDNDLACGGHSGMVIMSEHYTSGKTGAIDFTSDNQQVQNDSTEIEINDILNIIEDRDNELDATSTSATVYNVCEEKVRPMSVSIAPVCTNYDDKETLSQFDRLKDGCQFSLSLHCLP